MLLGSASHQLFISYFPGYKGDNEVILYDPVDGKRSQWKKTAAHWREVLSK